MIVFKPGDKVKYKCYDRWHIGTITLISKTMGIKVIFDGDSDLEYWYYPEDKLFLATQEDLRGYD